MAFNVDSVQQIKIRWLFLFFCSSKSCNRYGVLFFYHCSMAFFLYYYFYNVLYDFQ
ncbi:hypothetical protein Hanom_Chr04g00310971 [Helianthus anomalus]